MTKFDDQIEMVCAVDRVAWREWLQEHHLISLGIWLVYFKVKSGKPIDTPRSLERRFLSSPKLDS